MPDRTLGERGVEIAIPGYRAALNLSRRITITLPWETDPDA